MSKHEQHHKMKRRDIIHFLILRTLGNFFVLITIFGFFATFGPAIYFETRYQIARVADVQFTFADDKNVDSPLGKLVNAKSGDKTIKSANQESLLGTILNGEKEQILQVKDSAFSIVIPKIGASEKVNANVDPSNSSEYKKSLLSGVAHAKGSAFPGLNGTTYIFAHSADSFWNVGRYNAVFYLLKELVPGDDVIIVFNGKRFNYQVSEKKVVEPSDVQYIDANIGRGEQLPVGLQEQLLKDYLYLQNLNKQFISF